MIQQHIMITSEGCGGIAEKHYHGTSITWTSNDDNNEFRDRVVQYGNDHESSIRQMLSTISYTCYVTCTNYDDVKEERREGEDILYYCM